MPYIEIRDGSNKGQIHEITESSLTMGRDETESIQIFDQGVSRKHAEIFRMGEMYFIRDLGSRNGTYVNEEKIAEELLRVNDLIRVGNTELIFREGPPRKERPGPKFTHDKKLRETSTTIEYRLEHADPGDLEEPEDKGAALESKRIQILVQSARALAEERDVESLLKRVVDLSAEAVDADHAYVFIRAPDKAEMVIRARFEREGKKAPTVSTSVIRKVLRESRAILISDASQDPDFAAKHSVISKGIKSVIAAPLLSMKELQGVLFLHSTGAAREFTERDLQLVTAIALQAGIAYQSISFFRAQEEILLQAINTVLAAARMRDPSIADRSRAMARVASAIATVMKLPLEENRRIQLSALLHSIGEIAVDDEDEEEEEDDPQLQQARRAESLLRQNRRLSDLIPGIKHQFERMDGSGPDGLSGDEIPLSARILAVAKEYEESLAEGADSSAKSALLRLKESASSELDPKVVEALMIAYRNGTLERPEYLLGGL